MPGLQQSPPTDGAAGQLRARVVQTVLGPAAQPPENRAAEPRRGVAVLAVGAAARSRGVVEMAAHADGGRRAAAQGEAGAPKVPRVAAGAGEVAVALGVAPPPPGVVAAGEGEAVVLLPCVAAPAAAVVSRCEVVSRGE
ncbi:MAG: hypothetical protein QOD58_1048 [Mycobacterium sp.]|nr:hypothetical protein [Mycobacterium sp.]